MSTPLQPVKKQNNPHIQELYEKYIVLVKRLGRHYYNHFRKRGIIFKDSESNYNNDLESQRQTGLQNQPTELLNIKTVWSEGSNQEQQNNG